MSNPISTVQYSTVQYSTVQYIFNMFREDGMDIYSSTQYIDRVQSTVAAVLGLQQKDIDIRLILLEVYIFHDVYHGLDLLVHTHPPAPKMCFKLIKYSAKIFIRKKNVGCGGTSPSSYIFISMQYCAC